MEESILLVSCSHTRPSVRQTCRRQLLGSTTPVGLDLGKDGSNEDTLLSDLQQRLAIC